MKAYPYNKTQVRNIKACYERAGPDIAREGRDWYRQAFLQAQEWADAVQSTTAKVAQVISVLSPSVKWETNLRDAERLIFATPEERRKMKVSTYGPNKEKAIGILEGWRQFHFTGWNWKTYNFFHCIWNPTNETAVTIDRHAYAVAVKRKNKITEKRYGVTAASYRQAAHDLNLRPLELQAITWLQHLNEK